MIESMTDAERKVERMRRTILAFGCSIDDARTAMSRLGKAATEAERRLSSRSRMILDWYASLTPLQEFFLKIGLLRCPYR